MVWPAAIAAGASLAGGALSFFGGQNQNNQIAQNNQAQLDFARQNLAFQDAAAKNGIRWRVDDARAAGISPLIALGAPTFNPSPVAVGFDSPSNSMAGAGASLGKAGQDISSAIGRTMSEYEKASLAISQARMINEGKVQDATVNNLNAQANYYNARAAGTPSFPSAVNDTGQIIPGQAGGHVASGAQGTPAFNAAVGGYENKLPEVVTHQPGNPGVVGGRGSPGDQAYWTRGGMLEFQPAAGSPAAQGDLFNSAFNFLRNRLQLPGGPGSQGSDPAIYDKIRERYPDAVGYRVMGLGFYKPIFPEEQVRRDVRFARER